DVLLAAIYPGTRIGDKRPRLIDTYGQFPGTTSGDGLFTDVLLAAIYPGTRIGDKRPRLIDTYGQFPGTTS
ncbi:hypothetical protein, partial [Salmonella enterica]|uniref:hypothetical protein n=1 Tax=Salmonella enterica TaxID=28901 RepID=UPI0026330BB5